MRALQVEDMVSIILQHEHGFKLTGRVGKKGRAEEMVYAAYRTRLTLLYERPKFKTPFYQRKGAATDLAEKKYVIIWRPTEAGFRTKHATVQNPYNGKHEILNC